MPQALLTLCPCTMSCPPVGRRRRAPDHWLVGVANGSGSHSTSTSASKRRNSSSAAGAGSARARARDSASGSGGGGRPPLHRGKQAPSSQQQQQQHRRRASPPRRSPPSGRSPLPSPTPSESSVTSAVLAGLGLTAADFAGLSVSPGARVPRPRPIDVNKPLTILVHGTHSAAPSPVPSEASAPAASSTSASASASSSSASAGKHRNGKGLTVIASPAAVALPAPAFVTPKQPTAAGSSAVATRSVFTPQFRVVPSFDVPPPGGKFKRPRKYITCEDEIRGGATMARVCVGLLCCSHTVAPHLAAGVEYDIDSEDEVFVQSLKDHSNTVRASGLGVMRLRLLPDIVRVYGDAGAGVDRGCV